MFRTRQQTLRFVIVSLAACAAAAGSALAQEPVRVWLDMDARQPGRQHTVAVFEGTAAVPDIGVYITAASGQRSLWAIGYLGGIDRGIVFGHMPTNGNRGGVERIEAVPGTPVNPGNQPWIEPDTMMIKSFSGPEVQYLEFGASQPAPIQAEPAAPIFRATILLRNAQAGDVFDFHLLDLLAAQWGGNHGVISTQSGMSLDTGGDAVPDGTRTVYGSDPDTPVSVPPGAYAVDFVDGPAGGGAATIRVVPRGDVNGDCRVDQSDLGLLLAAFGVSAGGDLDGDGDTDQADLGILLAHFGRTCP